MWSLTDVQKKDAGRCPEVIVGFEVGMLMHWGTPVDIEFIQFALVQVKTMKVINEFLPLVQEQWADDAARQRAVIDPVADNAATQAQKQVWQDLIDRIDAMDSVVRALPTWTWPF